MARSGKKSRTILVKLVSSALTGMFYGASRPRLSPKLAMMKFDRTLNRHVLFIEKGRL